MVFGMGIYGSTAVVAQSAKYANLPVNFDLSGIWGYVEATMDIAKRHNLIGAHFHSHFRENFGY